MSLMPAYETDLVNCDKYQMHLCHNLLFSWILKKGSCCAAWLFWIFQKDKQHPFVITQSQNPNKFLVWLFGTQVFFSTSCGHDREQRKETTFSTYLVLRGGLTALEKENWQPPQQRGEHISLLLPLLLYKLTSTPALFTAPGLTDER